MNELVGITFILDTKAFINGTVPMSQAKDIIKGWMEGKMRGAHIACTDPPPGFHAWSVQNDRVVAIHTFPLQQTTGTHHLQGSMRYSG